MHSTSYMTAEAFAEYGGYGSGICPLCEKCWAELTPEQRLPFYRKLIDFHFGRSSIDGWITAARDQQEYDGVRRLVQAAVLNNG